MQGVFSWRLEEGKEAIAASRSVKTQWGPSLKGWEGKLADKAFWRVGTENEGSREDTFAKERL